MAAVSLVVLTTWSANDGGYGEVLWYPGALVLLFLLLVAEWALPGVRIDRRAGVALGALTLFTTWSFASIAWADDQGLALTGANRTLLYLVVFAVALRRPWTRRLVFSWASVWALAVVIVGLVSLLHATSSADPLSAFPGGRLALPIDYANANAALFVLAVWPLSVLAQDAAAPAFLRALGLGAGGIAFELALLAESKGAALGALATLLVYVTFGRGRVRRMVPLLTICAVAAVFARPLLDVYTRINDHGGAVAAVRSARTAVVVSFVVLVGLGWLIAVVDRRVFDTPMRTTALIRDGAGALMGVAALTALVAVFAVYGGPVKIARHGWHSFTNPASSSSASSHFVTSAGNHRYDFWRVAARQFKSAPLTGVGIENFEADYIAHRRTGEEPLYPHSIEARLLGGTGLIGFALFAVFLAAALASCWRLARGVGGHHATTGLVPLAMVLYWLAHGSVDWLWEFPALTAPLFFVLGATAVAAPAAMHRRGRARRFELSLAAAACAAGLVVLVPPWLAARDTQAAAAGWRADTAGAYAKLDNAARLDRLSDDPYVVAGTIAERRRDWPRTKGYFEQALRRSSRNWYSQLELAIADAELRDRNGALLAVRRAAALNPRDDVVRDVRRRIAGGRPLAVEAIDQALLARSRVIVRTA